jgi:hypothetical protein
VSQGGTGTLTFTAGIVTATGTSAFATVAAPAGTIVGTTDSQTLTNKTLNSPTLVTPALGTPTSGNLTNCTFPTLNQNTTGTAANLSGTPALPNGTAATTQASTDNSTKLATDAFVQTLTTQFATSTITADPAPGVIGTYYRCNYALGGNFTLPSSALTAGQWIRLKQLANNTLSLVGTVDGSTTYTLTYKQAVLLIWNGSSWDAN